MGRRVLSIVPTEALAGEVAGWLAEQMARAIALRGRCALAISGGATPRPAYEALAAPPLAGRIDWPRVDVYFGDERAVPPDHPDNNYRMAMDSLLGRIPIPAENVHRMPAERPDRDAAAREYEGLLPPRLDVLLLGMGTDGHTASLFPGSLVLEERRRRVLPAESPLPPTGRLTITPPVIAGAGDVAVMVSGAGKAAMVARALDGPLAPRAIPVQFARDARWFLDEAAGSLLAHSRRRA
jgi:6-phosphogluconolactonase